MNYWMDESSLYVFAIERGLEHPTCSECCSHVPNTLKVGTARHAFLVIQ